jgi:serine/threonine protein kinase
MSSELASSALTLGTSLQQGKYRLDQVICQSDHTIIYQATHRNLNQTVAIETLCHRPELEAKRAAAVQQFITRAQKVAKIHHPHLIHVNDLFVDFDLPFMVMDYAAGASLGKVALQKAIPTQQALDYIRQVAPAVARLHQHQYLHGNLNPDALVLRSQDHQVILTNLGLEHERNSSSPEGYTAPEQYHQPRGLTPATDIYALAASLYTLVTGHRPISASSREQNSLPPPRQLCPQLSSDLEQAILSGMEIKASDRPQTVEQWLSLLPPSASVEPVPQAKANAATATPKAADLTQIPEPTVTTDLPSLPSALSKTMSTPLKPAPHLQPQFPLKALWISGGIAGLVGLGIGFIVRFQYLTQFATPQTSGNPIQKVKRESFPPRPKTATPDLQDNQRLTIESNQNEVVNAEPERPDNTGTGEEQAILRYGSTSSTDQIMESEIGEFSPELTPTGIIVPPNENSTTSDWSDLLPSRSAYQTGRQPNSAPESELPPAPGTLDGPSPSSDLDREFLPPQI